MAKRGRWPTSPVLYEIYPRSFRDTTGSGEGDLRGILDGLDHVARLGVDGIWIAPFFRSPMDDAGYDVSDHSAVDPRYGDIDDFDAIVARAHDLNLCVMIDQVLNHTSDQHPKFLAALDGDDEAAAYYVFRDPNPDGSPPNNWRSFFGPPAWSWAHKREQYYMHQFLACQPSLDLRHQGVRDMHRRELEFWRDRGVDGFRFDAVTSYLFDQSLADNPPADPETKAKVAGPRFSLYTYQDHVHDMLPGDGFEYAKMLRTWCGDSAYLFGEINSGNRLVELAGMFVCDEGLDSGYTIDLPETGGAPETVCEMIRRDDGSRAVAWWLTSHDQPRHARNPAHARFYALLFAVLPGPWLIFQGDELGLPQPRLEKDEVTDAFDVMYWPDGPGREGPRVPIPWTQDAPRFGFTDGTPWLPMRWDPEHSVAAQEADAHSVLAFYRRAITLRREHGFGAGAMPHCSVEDDVLTLDLEAGGAQWRAIFNGSDVPVSGLDRAPELASMSLGEDGRLPPGAGALWRV